MDSLLRVVNTVVLPVEELLKRIKNDISDIKFVYNEKLTYESIVEFLRARSDLYSKNVEIPYPIFAFRRTALRYASIGAQKRSISEIVRKVVENNKNIIYRKVFGEFDIEFLWITKNVSEIENFEIAYLSEEGISGIREISVEIPQLGNFSYYTFPSILESKVFESEGNYYKMLSGKILVRGFFFVLRGDNSIILNIEGRIKNFYSLLLGSFVKGKLFQSRYNASLDGVDEYIDLGQILQFTETDEFTVSCWFKAFDRRDWEGMIGYKTYSYQGWALMMLNGGQAPGFLFNGQGGAWYKAMSTVINLNQWYHVTAVYKYVTGNWNTDITLYLDGVIRSYVHGSGSASQITYDTQKCYIGLNMLYYWGVLGDIVVLPIACTESEVLELYNGGKEKDMTTFSRWNEVKSNPKTLWVTWENDNLGGGGSVVDLSNNHYVGTPINMESSDKVEDVP